MNNLSLEDLLSRVSLRDRKAFSELYDRTSAKLFSVSSRILIDRAESEDAVQEAYVKIWRMAGSYNQNKASPMTWMITITRNAAIDQARKRKAPSVEVSEIENMADGKLSPEALAVMSDDYRALNECLDELEAPQKNAVRTAFFQGATYTELAERSDTPLGTVKSWIRRSLLKLRDCLERGGHETVESTTQ